MADQDDFNEELGRMFGKGTEGKYFYDAESESDRVKLEGYLKQFILENKMGGKIKFYPDNLKLYVTCTDYTMTKLENWLSDVGTDYMFRMTYKD